MKLARLAVLASSLWTVTGCASFVTHNVPSITGRASCSPLDYVAMIREANEGTPADGFIRVPVAIHIMDRPGRDAGGHKVPVLRFWAPRHLRHDEIEPGDDIRRDGVRAYLDATSIFGVNQIWAQAGIRFDVQLVERCFYAAPPPQTDNHVILTPESSDMWGDPPKRQQERIDAYLETNALYGIPRTLNVYMWTTLAGPANGYSESPRRRRIEVAERGIEALPTVWVDIARCRDDDSLSCRTFLAHELGHALGLKHTCWQCSEDCCGEFCLHLRSDYHSRGLDNVNVCGTSESCSQSRRYYYKYNDHLVSPDDIRHLHMPASHNGECCCECEPGQDVREGLNLCGQGLGCCDLDHFDRKRLMYPYVDDPTNAGTELCLGEIHSARAAATEFFYGNEGGEKWKR